MNTNEISSNEAKCVEGFRMMLQGMSMVFGTMASSLENGQAEMPELAKRMTGKTAPAKAAAPVPQEKAEVTPEKKVEASDPVDTGGEEISRSDVERAMGAKIKELAKAGKSPEVVGKLFPMFHNAQCVSDLKKADYPLFLTELAKI